MSTGALAPGFNPSVFNYTVSIPFGTTNITFTPTAWAATSSITINGTPITSGSSTGNIPLNLGPNLLTMIVTATNGTAKTYAINVTLEDNANLVDLTVSAGPLSPAFSGQTTNYWVRVPNATTNLVVTPISAQANATITVNGAAVASGTASGNIPLNEGPNDINTTVTATNGFSTKTYTVTVHRAPIVSNIASQGAGSLRQALIDTKASPGADIITFSPALSGQTILLTNGSLVVNDADGVTIDASTLPGGITIDGHRADRVFLNNGYLSLRALALTGGFVSPGAGGGAVVNNNTMTLERCTLSGNTAGYGGAIWNNPGAIMTLRQCTIAENTASQSGGIENRGVMTLVHCTVADNTAPTIGGIFNYLESLTIENCIVAGNSGGLGNDVNNQGTITTVGANIVQTSIPGGGPITVAGTITNLNPMLHALGNYGGPNRTMPPQSGSPAIDSAVGSTQTIDQRGCARPLDGDSNGSSIADIGAVEFGLDISAHPVSQTVLAGANVGFSVTAVGLSPYYYKWFFNNSAIPAATSSVLNLTNVNRTKSGLYFVVVTNEAGSFTSTNALLHVLVPQKLQALTQGSNGKWFLNFNDADGALLTTNELGDFEVQFSTNLTQWTSFTNAFTLTNGIIYFTEPNSNSTPARFFRVLSK